jgi:hypothetical protein
LLPKEEQTKPEEVCQSFTGFVNLMPHVPVCVGTNICIPQDILYLTPIIKEIEAERKEREDLESMVIKRRAA